MASPVIAARKIDLKDGFIAIIAEHKDGSWTVRSIGFPPNYAKAAKEEIANIIKTKKSEEIVKLGVACTIDAHGGISWPHGPQK